MEAVSMGSGMTLHVIPSEKFTTDTLCILLRRPLCREEVTANALLPPILSRGTEQYPTITQVALATERMQGSLFESQIIKKGEQQILQFYFECVHDLALQEEGLRFLQEMMLRPRIEGEGFDRAYVRSESDYLSKRIEGRVNNKREYARFKCIERMCEDEPFGLYGDGYVADLSTLTAQSLLYQYKKIVSASPMDFIALGQWNKDVLKERLLSLFSVYRDEIVPISQADVRAGRAEPYVERIETGAAQGNMCIGLRGAMETSGDEYIHFQLANEVLGGSANGKLFVNVREKESLCYQIRSIVYRFKGILCIESGVDAAQFERVLSLVEEQIASVKRGEITDEELENAKQSLRNRWYSLKDYPSGHIDFYASQYLLANQESIDEMAARVSSAGKDGIAAAAGKLKLDTVVMLT